MRYFIFLLSLAFNLSLNAQLSFYDIEPSYTGTSHPSHVRFILSYDLDKDGLEDLLHIQGNQLFAKKQENEIFLDEELVHTHTSDFFNFSNKADINGDGQLDFLILTESSILTFLGTNDGVKFGAEIEANTPQQPLLVDFNKDGNIDIIYNSSDWKSPYVNQLYFIEGNGDGSFMAETSLTSGISDVNQIREFKVNDVEKDGDLDLIIREFDGVHIVLNDQFTFTLHSSIVDPTSSLYHLEVGDFNLDGLTDIVVTDQSNHLHIYSNRSTSFEKTYTYETINLASVIAIDYDVNGRIDLIVSNIHNSLTFISNNGDETFASPIEANRSIPRVINPSLSDFNNDGNLDIVAIGNIQTGYQRALLIPLDPNVDSNVPYISMSLRPYIPFSNGTEFGDLDNDGLEDLIIISQNGGVYIFYANADGFESDYQFLESPIFTTGGFLGDIDADGDLDIITRKHSPNNGTNGTDIIYNNGNRTYQDFQRFKYLPNPSGISLVDIDNNGTKNLACYMSFYKEVVFLEPDNTSDYFDDTKPRILTDDFIETILYEDFNGDSWVDVIISVNNSHKIEIHINDQMGGFEAPTFFDLEINEEATALSLKDVDGDDKKEFIIATTDSNSDPKLKIFKRTDESSPFELEDEFIIETFSGASDIQLEDFNGDGNLDFYLKNTSGFYVYSEDPSPGYVKSNFDLSDFGTFDIGFRDFNADGFKDLVRVRRSAGTTMISLNNTVIDPDTAPTTASVSQTEPGSALLTMSKAEYSGRLVLISEEAESGIPQDGIFYSSNPKMGVGSQIEDGFVIHSGKEEEVVITGLASEANYSIRIFEYNVNEPDNSIINYQTSSFTTVEFTSLKVLSVVDENQTLKVLPNPFKSHFSLDVPSNITGAQYQILEVSGKVIKQGVINGRTRIDLSGSKPGVYILRYFQDDIISSTSIIKRR